MHDDTAPATKGDLLALEKRMNARFAGMEEQFEKIDKQFEKIDERFRRMHEDIGRVLNVLINFEKSVGGTLENHEQRIAHLETAVL